MTPGELAKKLKARLAGRVQSPAASPRLLAQQVLARQQPRRPLARSQAQGWRPSFVLRDQLRQAFDPSGLLLDRGRVLARVMTQPLPLEPPKGLRTVDVFAGGGLLSLALELEGAETLAVCERAESACATLRANLGDAYREARPVVAHAFNPEIKGSVDLLIGGPPCVLFSRGRRLGTTDRPSDLLLLVTHEENLYPRVLDWMADLRPRVVVLENSLEVVRAEKYKPFLRWMQAQMKALGYASTTWGLNAADYGTPQARERGFLVAWPEAASWGEVLLKPPPATHARPGSLTRSGARLPWTLGFDRLTSGCCNGFYLVDCRNLGNLDLKCRGCTEARNFEPAPNTTGDQGRRGLLESLEGDKGRLLHRIRYLLETGAAGTSPDKRRIDPSRGGLGWRNPADKAGVWAWKELADKARVITQYLAHTVTPRWTEGRPDGLVIPWGNVSFGTVSESDEPAMRRAVEALEVASVRDAAKLQDVPQWYEFKGDRQEAFLQIGNGVPVNLGRAVVRHVRRALGLPVIPKWGEVAAQQHGGTFVPDGLWPTDRVDPCAGFVGIEGSVYAQDEMFDELSMQTYEGLHRLTRAERRERPYAQPSFFRPPTAAEQKARRQAGGRMAKLYPSGLAYNEDARIDPAFLANELRWSPQHLQDVPAPLDDLETFQFMLRTAGGSAYNHFARVWMQKFGSKGVTLWPDAGGDLPVWSSYRGKD
jgi:site-specific DNA-cytosine methylase